MTADSPARTSSGKTKLADLRNAAGMTQKQLADTLGCARSLITQWELGTVPLPEARIPVLAAALHCQPSDLTCLVRERKTRKAGPPREPPPQGPRKGPRNRDDMTKLADLRIASGLTQQQLADHIGVRKLSISRWERGYGTPSRKYLVKMAEALRCSPDDLIGAVNDAQKQEITSTAVCTVCGKEFAIYNRVDRKSCSPECEFVVRSLAHRRKVPETKMHTGSCAPSPDKIDKLSASLTDDAPQDIIADGNRTPRLCDVCGQVIPFGSGRYRYCSQHCADIGERRRANDATAGRSRASVYTTKRCADCGTTFFGHIKSCRCLDCQILANKKHNKEYAQRVQAGKSRPIGSIDRCEACGKEYIVNGGLQRYCKDCAPEMLRQNDRAASRTWNRAAYATPEAKEKKNASKRQRDPIRRACAHCGKMFDVTAHLKAYCSDDCRQAAKRAYYKAYDAQRPRRKEPSPDGEKKEGPD